MSSEFFVFRRSFRMIILNAFPGGILLYAASQITVHIQAISMEPRTIITI